MPRSLHQSTPTFHGDRIRLRPGFRKQHFDLVAALSDPADDAVATVFLPLGMDPEVVREACQAFNTVMDRHEQKAADDSRPLKFDIAPIIAAQRTAP